MTAFAAVAATGFLFDLAYSEIIAEKRTQPKNEIIRNLGLLIAASLAAFLAVWRSQIAGHQAESASRQAETGIRQAETSERGLRNERYQRGAEMLGSEVISTRLGGLYALKHLALDHPEDYLDQIIKLIATFVRHPSQGEKEMAARPQTDASRKLKFRRDVWEAIVVIAELNESDVAHDAPNLTLADLRHMRLISGTSKPNYSGFDFTGAQLDHANFVGANLTDANFMDAHLTNAKLVCANFTGANLAFAKIDGADLTGAALVQVIGLQQAQLDTACFGRGANPPRLPPGCLTWDEDAAIERWHKHHGNSAQE